MRYFLIALKLIIFFVSNLGYWNYFNKKTKMNIFFLPAFTVAFQIFILFFCGLLNVLYIGTILLYLIGIILFLRDCYKDGIKTYLEYLNSGYLYLLIGIIVIAFAVRGKIFTHYDNFSHWAIVVKEMLRTNKYPNFENFVIQFKAYPLGSSTYIYYFSKLIDEAESVQMLAQVYMMLTCILPLFSFVKKYKIISVAYIILLTNFLFVFNININDLLVDTLLPLFGVTAILFTYYECYTKCCDKKIIEVPDRSILCTIPFLSTVVLIKNSGMFFVIIACFILLRIARKYKKLRLISIASIISPFIISFLWKRHCTYVFANSATSKHAMTVANYKQVFCEKTITDIKKITKSMIEFSFAGKDLWLIILTVLSLGAITIICKRDFIKKYMKYLGVSVLIYTVYMIGMLFMYLFSMPTGEAISLACSDRYRRTVLIAILMISSIYAFQLLSELKNIKKIAIGFSVIFFMLLCTWKISCGSFATVFNNTESEGSITKRLWIEEAISDYKVPFGKSYAICIPNNDCGYEYYIGKYLLSSNNVTSPIVTQESQLDSLKNYDYIFNHDSNNKVIKYWIKENYPEQIGNDVIVIKETNNDKE